MMDKPYFTIIEDIKNDEIVYTFHVPKSFIAQVKDWRYSLLLEIALMMAKPNDFIS
jgi:hypothetical protein